LDLVCERSLQRVGIATIAGRVSPTGMNTVHHGKGLEIVNLEVHYYSDSTVNEGDELSVLDRDNVQSSDFQCNRTLPTSPHTQSHHRNR
jgi:hypothetical protein